MNCYFDQVHVKTTILFCFLDDYDQALQKLKRAEDTSDLQTEFEEDIRTKSRKIQRPSKFIESSSDEEYSILPAPPKIKRTLFKKGTNIISLLRLKIAKFKVFMLMFIYNRNFFTISSVHYMEYLIWDLYLLLRKKCF